MNNEQSPWPTNQGTKRILYERAARGTAKKPNTWLTILAVLAMIAFATVGAWAIVAPWFGVGIK